MSEMVGALQATDQPCGEVMVKRLFDIVFSLFGLVLFGLPMCCIAGWVVCVSPGPPLHWSKRIGRANSVFFMPKFRTMRRETPQIATHLMDQPERYLIPGGELLRRFSLDELPQLFSILKGDMSFVGPRPALFNQDDLIALRVRAGAHLLTPGLTGWAQINGRDELPIPVKVEYDKYYLEHCGLWFDLLILWRTLTAVLKKEGVHH